MNPYTEYTSIDYDTISERETLILMDGLFSITRDEYDEGGHYTAINAITLSALKLNYESVKDRLRKTYPLSFPEIEKYYPDPPPDNTISSDSISPAAPIMNSPAIEDDNTPITALAYTKEKLGIVQDLEEEDEGDDKEHTQFLVGLRTAYEDIEFALENNVAKN